MAREVIISERSAPKAIVERRHGEPIKFLFLPKMDLLCSQASADKKLVTKHELFLRALH